MRKHDPSSAGNRLMLSDGGRRARFASLYAACYQQIAGYVRRRVAADEAEDVIAQIFAVAWRRFDRIPPPPDDRLWLFGVARNTVAQHHRSERRRLRLHARLREEAMTALPYPVEPDSRHEPVRAAIAALPAREREALQLVLWDELSHAEAASVLGCSPNAFEIRYRRARNAVRAAISAAPQAAAPQMGAPQVTEPQVTEPQVTEPPAAEPPRSAILPPTSARSDSCKTSNC